MAQRNYKPRRKSEREMAALIFTYKMPSTGPYVSPNRHMPFFETEEMLTEFVNKGWALREGTTDHKGASFACMTYEGAMHFGFPWHGTVPEQAEQTEPEAPVYSSNLREAVLQRLKAEYGEGYVDFDAGMVFAVILSEHGLIPMSEVPQATWELARSRGHR